MKTLINLPSVAAAKSQWISDNLKPGEVYAGLMLAEQEGDQDYHLIVMVGEVVGVTFKQAHEWAKKAGGDLPTRLEQRVLFANAKAAFHPAWYWSGEKHASDSDYAWSQSFNNGGQLDDYAGNQLRARAVRRLFI